MRVVTTAIASALLLGVVLVGPPADAGTRCPKGRLCVWTEANFTGTRLVLRRSDDANAIFDGGLNDDVSSVKNNRGSVSFLFEDTNEGGGNLCLSSHQKVSDLTSVAFNNTASSSRLSDSKFCV